MSGKHGLHDYLAHMRFAAAEACGLVETHQRADFLDDKRTQLAVIADLTTVGEAAARIMNRYPEFIAAHPEIQWEKIRGLRNHVVHDYTNIKLDVLWTVVQVSLPELLTQLSAIQVEE